MAVTTMPLPAPLPKVPLSGPRNLLPKDSPEYAVTTLEELRFRWANVRDDERRFMATLAEVVEARIFERWPAGAPYGDVDRLCRGELGTPLHQVRETVATTERERVIRAANATTGAALPEGRPEKLGNVPSSSRASRAAVNGVSDKTQGKLDRLAMDFKPLHEQVKSGELSVDRAYRMALGKPGRITVLAEPQALADGIRRHLTREQIAELIRLLEGAVR
jgi:hypothetical protein